MKRLRIGRRRHEIAQSSPLELARAPALADGRWRVPDRFNFTRDVVEVLGRDPKRQALTFVGADSVIEPRTFAEIAEGANKWTFLLRERGIPPGDRVLVLSGTTVDWVEIVLGCIKAGVVAVTCPPGLSATTLEARVSVSGASLIVAGDDAKGEIAQMSFAPEVHHIFEGRRRRSTDTVDPEPTADTTSSDVALLVWTSGTAGDPKPVAHTHAWTFAARCQTEHWLDAGPGDVVWCTSPGGSMQALASTIFGPWARGAEIVLQDGEFDPMERLELIHRFEATILCQTPAEYRALAGRRELPRFRSGRLRRVVSTGASLDPDVIPIFEEVWGTTIHDGYGQAETGVVVGHQPSMEEAPPGSLGRALPGHHVAVVDEQGNEVPYGIEGSLAVRGRPPTLFAGYWEASLETRGAFRGDWYVTGDVAIADEDGVLWLIGRAEDVITSRERTFGPHDVERALRAHAAVADGAVVGIRDLERGGHFVRAFVVLAPGVEGSEQLEAELRQFASESLPEQQVPREIEFVEELPHSTSGAVKRGELRDRPVAGRPLWQSAAAPESPGPAVDPGPVPRSPTEAPPAAEASAAAASGPHATPVIEQGREVVVETVLEPVVEVLAEPIPEAILEAGSASPAVEPEAEAAPSAGAASLEPAAELVPEPQATVEVIAPTDVEQAPPSLHARPEPEQPVEPVLEPVAEPPVDVASETPAHVVEAAPEPRSEPITETAPDPEPRGASPLRPLPDYVEGPGHELEPATLPEPAPETQTPEPEEEDLGPLPEYVVDPERRLEVVASPGPESTPAARAPERDDSLIPAFPPVPVLDLGAPSTPDRSSDEGRRGRRAAPRPRPPASESDASKRGGSTAEPGDEPAETGWMQGLSSRLSAYSLGSEAGDSAPDDQHDDAAKDEAGG